MLGGGIALRRPRDVTPCRCASFCDESLEASWPGGQCRFATWHVFRLMLMGGRIHLESRGLTPGLASSI